MKYLLLLIMGLFAVSTAQAEIYKYFNKQGKTAYSDVRVKNSQKIKLQPVMTYEPSPIVVVPAIKEAKKEGDVKRIPYQSLQIISPKEQGTIRDNQGSVAVAHKLTPKVQKGDMLELYIDGIKQPGLIGLGIERGEHLVWLQVVDKDGHVWIKSDQVTFFLRHKSKLINKKIPPPVKKKAVTAN